MSGGSLCGVKWSAGDTARVEANLDMPIQQLAAMFPDRAVESVRQKVKTIRRKIRHGFVPTITVWDDVTTARLIELHAQGLSDEAIGERLCVTKKAVAAKRARLKLSGVKAKVDRRRPDDFADFADSLTVRELCQRYGCRHALIATWRAEIGIKGKVRSKAAPQSRSPRRPHVYSGPIPTSAPVDGSLAAQAGRWLMRDFRPVCRVTTINPKADKDLWIVGRNTLTTAELVEKAESRGFNVKIAA